MNPVRSLSVATGALALLVAASCADLSTGTAAVPTLRAVEADRIAHAVLPPVRISEFHYDNTGTDAGEAVEVSAPAGTDLTGWTIVLYNGANGAVYDTDALPTPVPATCGARGVVVVNYPSNGIQNGSPDGIALVNGAGTVVEFLSYEGAFTAIGGPANGMASVNIPVTQTGSEPLGASIFRDGTGAWFKSSATNPSSFGACNDDNEPQVVVDHVTVAPAAAEILEGATQQFSAAAYEADGDAIPGVTFTWTTSASSVAAVNGSGLATGISAGDVEIRASAGGKTGAAALRVNEAPLPNLPAVRFSEVHYDNVGVDVGEALEIEGPAGTDVSGWSVVLYNGSNGTAYDTRPLSGAIPATCDARGVVVLRYEQDGIQNGGPDGFALVDAAGEVVELLSYEGSFTATDGPATGRQSLDIGVFQSSAPHFQTLQRRPSGKWDTLKPSTLGGCYGSTPVTPANQVSFSGRVVQDAPLPVGFEDQLFGTLRAPDNQTIETTFTWEALTPAVATIDADGVMRAHSAGTATFRGTAADGTTNTYSLPMAVATASGVVYGNHAEFGEPADGDASDDYVLRRTEFTSSFNRTRNIPNWVSYNLDATHIVPGQDRCDCFTYDPLLPADFARYTTADYTGAGAVAGFGIDRGHLTRSFDRTAGSLDNARTFYFSNIIPQASDNNQGPWAAFESHLGGLAQNDNREVYVIAGASGSQGTVKNEGLITIPSVTWKVAVIMPRDQGLANVDSHDDVQVLAVVMPNVAGIRTTDWQTYLTTVNEVERVSGYDVLALLPDGVESLMETGLSDEMAIVDGLQADGTLNAGNANSLRAKLSAAAEALERGQTTAARNQLEALLNEVNAMERSRRLTETQASVIRAAIQAVLSDL